MKHSLAVLLFGAITFFGFCTTTFSQEGDINISRSTPQTSDSSQGGGVVGNIDTKADSRTAFPATESNPSVWLAKNKEWVFSGVGTLIISTVVGLILSRRRRA